MRMRDPIIDRSPEQKLMRAEKLRAELRQVLRQSIPTENIHQWWECGWQYIMPDFDKPDHSIVEWSSEKMPVYPCVPETIQPRNANERATSGA